MADAQKGVVSSKRPKQKDRGLLNPVSVDMIATGGDEAVSVCIRVRPFNRRELEIHKEKNPDEFIRSVVEMPEGVNGIVRMLERNAQTGEYQEVETFHYTKTFWSIPEEQQPSKYLPITQEDVFDCVGRVILTNSISGFNSCVFAYGQTGSGKTYTMMGDFHTSGGEFTGDPGLMPRMCRELFTIAQRKKESVEAENPLVTLDFDIKLSALEIYNEQVRDLFWKGSPFVGRTKTTILKIRHHPTDGAFVDQLTVLNPTDWEDCIRLIAAGVSERTVAATLMNDESSRSHSVFQIVVQQSEAMNPDPNDPAKRFDKPVVTKRISRINLVDLAGSERNKKSGAQGQQLKEAAGINQSLSTLKKVIDTLVQNCTEKNPKKHVIVPYRESALTMLLSHSLGGNSKTTMIACVSPHYDNQEETLNTLRYANRAKGIVNHVKANEDDAQRQAMLLREQIAELQKKLAEGPQAYTPQQIEDLRDQLEVGQKALTDMQAQQKEREAEASRLAAVYKTQKDARYAATYYNSFKRLLLMRHKELAEKKIRALDAELQVVSVQKEFLTNNLTAKESSAREAKYAAEELKRKGELWELKSARNEAMARQLVREIAKQRTRADEHLSSRYGLLWMRNKEEKKLRMTLEQQKEAIRKDHEQFLQSIVREAKKQYDNLVAAYADKEAAQRERLETMERGRVHALSQLDKTEQLLYSLESTLTQSQEDQARRQKEREDSWQASTRSDESHVRAKNRRVVSKAESVAQSNGRKGVGSAKKGTESQSHEARATRCRVSPGWRRRSKQAQ